MSLDQNLRLNDGIFAANIMPQIFEFRISRKGGKSTVQLKAKNKLETTVSSFGCMLITLCVIVGGTAGLFNGKSPILPYW